MFANGMLVLAHQSSDRLDIFNPALRRVVAQVPGMSSPHGLAVDASRGHVYVANSRGNNVAVVSSKDWKLERTFPVERAPYSLALSPDGRTLLIGNWQDQSVTALDPASGKAVTANLGGSPQELVFGDGGRVVYVTLQDTAEVVAIDPATLKVLRRTKLSGSQPTGLVLDSSGQRLYVAVREAVIQLDASSGAELGRAAAPKGADSLWLDSANGLLYLASSGGYVSIFSVQGGLAPVAEVHTEVRGHSLAYDPARKLVFLPGGHEGRSKLLILKQILEQPAQRAQQVAIK